MFKNRTLFVVGAGASFEAGLPVGAGLAQQIRKKMDVRFELGSKPIGTGDFELLRDIMTRNPRPDNVFQRAAWRIRDGIQLAASIDDFLDQHQSNQEVKLYGKAATVKCILEAERESPLYIDTSRLNEPVNLDKLQETWYVKFLKLLNRETPRENVREIFNNVAFIVFNYDRCIEQFLRSALQVSYGIPEQEAEDICSDLRIIHPYGLVADLPMHGRSPGTVRFGADSYGADYVGLAENIRNIRNRFWMRK